MKDQGIEVRFVDPIDPHNFRKATDDRTRAYYAETLPNPKLTVFPIAEVAEIGRNFGIPLIMDNTASPILTKPFEHGAAIVVYSSTKYMGGHGNSIGGILVDSGTFDWAAHPVRQPALNTPDPSYHGAVWTEAVKPLGPIAYIIKARVTLLRDLGSSMAPFNAFLTLQGLETLALRMAKHCENTQLVTDYLRKRPEITRVIHPSVQGGVHRQRAEKYLKGGLGGLVGFELAGGTEAGRRFIDALGNVLPRRQYRRRAQPRHPSGDDDAFAAVAAGAGRDRRVRRLCAPLGRHRAYRRHHRRHRARPQRRRQARQGGVAGASLRGANGAGPKWPAPLTGSATKQSRLSAALDRFARNDELILLPLSGHSRHGRTRCFPAPGANDPSETFAGLTLRARPTPGLYCSATSGMIFPISMAWLGGSS